MTSFEILKASGEKEPFNIHFLGAAGTVTGSKFLLELHIFVYSWYIG
ncbi:MAG: hypothetical protein WD355_04680 [Balneolaceae bacterium]